MKQKLTPRRLARLAWPVWVGGIFSTLSVAREVSNWLRAQNLLRLTVAGIFTAATGALLFGLLRHERFRRWRLVPVLLGLAALAAVVALPSDTPEERLHLVEYGVVALLSELALPERWSALRRFTVALLMTVGVGWCDELVQALLPTRHYDLHDVLLNGASGLLALLGRQAVVRALPEPPKVQVVEVPREPALRATPDKELG